MTTLDILGMGIRPAQKLVLIAGCETGWDITAMCALLGRRPSSVLRTLADLQSAGLVSIGVGIAGKEEKGKEKEIRKESEKEKEKRKEAKENNKKNKLNKITDKNQIETEENDGCQLQDALCASAGVHARTGVGAALPAADDDGFDFEKTNTNKMNPDYVMEKAAGLGRECTAEDASRIAAKCAAPGVSSPEAYLAKCLASLPEAGVSKDARLKAKRDAEDRSFRMRQYRTFTADWLRDFMGKRFRSPEKMREYIRLSLQKDRQGDAWVYDIDNSMWGEYGGDDSVPLNALRDRNERDAGVTS